MALTRALKRRVAALEKRRIAATQKDDWYWLIESTMSDVDRNL